MMKAGQTAFPKTVTPQRRNHATISVANYLPDNFDPSTVDEATVHAIDVLNEKLIAGGARLLAVGLAAPNQAKSLQAHPDGEVLITDGPHLEAKEHVGGFCILEALTWTRRWGGFAGPP